MNMLTSKYLTKTNNQSARHTKAESLITSNNYIPHNEFHPSEKIANDLLKVKIKNYES